VLLALALGVLMVYLIITRPLYTEAFEFVLEGVRLTIVISIVSFALALLLGLIAGLGRVSRNVIFTTLSSFYVEIVRGIPLLVLLIYFAFVVTPLILEAIVWFGSSVLQPIGLTGIGGALAAVEIRDVDMTVRAVAGLAFCYGAFEAEVFRAGIESIARGQMEAARSLGMTYPQAMRYVILPQAIRRVLPPFGNDFIAMIKDSALVSALAVADLTHLGKLHRARTFRTFETWNTVTFLYLLMTLSLSAGVKFLERRMSFEE
jgi:polar amino acid transport system permease protein